MTLRIQKSTERGRIVFRLIGRIKGVEIPALRELFRSAGRGFDLVLDLKEVKLVDREVVLFLSRCEVEGALLKNCSAFIWQWILQERKRMRSAEAERPET